MDNKNKTNENDGQPKMTREQRIKLKKLKKKSEQEALLKRLQQHEAEREIKMIEKNTKIVKKKMFQICEKEVERDYKDMMIESWNLFSKSMDMKDDIINQLMKSLDDLETQRRLSFQEHVSKTDIFLTEFYKELDYIKTKKDIDIEKLFKNRKYSSTTDLDHERQKEYMNFLLFLINKQTCEKIEIQKGIYYGDIEEENSKNQLDTIKKMNKMSDKIEQIYKEYQRIRKEYKMDTTETIKNCGNLYNKVRKDDKEVADKRLKILLLQIEIAENTKKLKESDKKSEIIIDLEKKNKLLRDAFKKKCNQIAEKKILDEKKLTKLVENNQNIIKHLETIKHKGEKVMKLHVICQKMAIKENVRPYNCHITRFNTLIEGKLRRFFRLIIGAEISIRILTARLIRLRNRNKQLKSQIKTYFKNV
ncbi:dynein regulatory complex subunit 2-like [Lycorma delicatula]|uniref:dynein regulatory complex subunit 2-like n=1 Tax=Lycorma delicatula TaxID=130591 RepID=UPI003F51A62F